MSRTIFIWGLISIFFGGLIYLGYRDESLIMFNWVDTLKLAPYVNIYREWLYPTISVLPNSFIYSLPNALWSLGGLLLIASIWANESIERYIWSLIFIIGVLSSEFLQGIIIPGTFDVIDILYIFLSIITANRIIKIKLRRNKCIKSLNTC